VEAPREEFDPKVAAVAAGDTWVIDGNYISHAGAERRARADTVCWFDLPTSACLWSVLRRTLGSYGRVRPEMAPGCPERFDAAFYRYVWTFRTMQRPKMLAYFGAMRPDQRLVTFTRRAQADLYLATITGPGAG
jgi:adenylate kinase family enzyme